jgi:hypothetical protein
VRLLLLSSTARSKQLVGFPSSMRSRRYRLIKHSMSVALALRHQAIRTATMTMKNSRSRLSRMSLIVLCGHPSQAQQLREGSKPFRRNSTIQQSQPTSRPKDQPGNSKLDNQRSFKLTESNCTKRYLQIAEGGYRYHKSIDWQGNPLASRFR